MNDDETMRYAFTDSFFFTRNCSYGTFTAFHLAHTGKETMAIPISEIDAQHGQAKRLRTRFIPRPASSQK